MIGHLPTGIKALDVILNGGIPLRQLTLVYGIAKSGKTTLLLQTAISTAAMFKVLYIDVDGTFNVARFKQICDKNLAKVSNNIMIFNPENFDQQTAVVENLESYITNNTKLIIIDAISTLYRVGYSTISQQFGLNRELNRQLAYLSGIAFQHDLAILMSSPVRSAFSVDYSEVEPVARRTIFHWPTTIIRLKSTESVNVKQAVIERLSSQNIIAECLLRLGEKGFTEH